MPSIFTRIINKEIPGHIIHENENFFCILDIRPVNPGHVLVIPRKEVDYIFDLDDEVYNALFAYAKSFAPALKKATGSSRVGIVVEGFGVPHAHIHLIPINNPHELDPHRAHAVSDEELVSMKEKIISCL